MEYPPNRFLLQCQFIDENLVKPKPQERVWVMFMMYWINEPAHCWANYLITTKHSFLRLHKVG